MPVFYTYEAENVKILVGKTEAHAEVEKKSRVLIFEEDLVAADLVHSSVEREGSHYRLRVGHAMEKDFA